MRETPHYEIRTVRDFLLVPEKRLGACLREFRIMLDMARASVGLLDAVSDSVIGEGKLRWQMGECFTWIDDKERTATLNIRIRNTPVATPTPSEEPTR